MRALALLGCGIALFLSGCKTSGEHALRFSHAQHIEGMELSCADCHGELSQGQYGRAGHESCAPCHAEAIEGKIARETCGLCHLVEPEQLAVRAKQPAAGPVPDAVFRHSDALADHCRDCHEPTITAGLDANPVLSKEQIRGIRAESHRLGRSCDDCHEGVNARTMPPSHGANWQQRHGAMANLDYTCDICHPQNNCRECHQAEKPLNHNTLWALRSHGAEAAWNREKCRTCHEDDFCTTCHRDTKPVSHNGGWRDARHCLPCHQSYAGCRTCHEEGIEVHGEGIIIDHPPQPFPCLTCHDPVTGIPQVRIQPSRHPFLNETACLGCHRY